MTESLTGDADTGLQEGSETSGETGQEEGWFYADNMPGEGERPEFLQPKFKSVAEQAKSYTELEKKFGGFKGAPENYEVTLPEELQGKVNINPEDGLYKTFAEIAKKSNMNNETFNEIVSSYAKQISEQQQVNLQEELKKVGENAGQRLGNLKRWAENNLNENELSIFHSLTTSADAVLLFEKIKGMTSEAIAPISGTSAGKGVSMPDIMELMKDPRYAENASYREEVRRKIREFAGE